MREELYYCDNDCDSEPFTSKDAHFVKELPCDIATANKGESAVLCKGCYQDLIEDIDEDEDEKEEE